MNRIRSKVTIGLMIAILGCGKLFAQGLFGETVTTIKDQYGMPQGKMTTTQPNMFGEQEVKVKRNW